MVSGFDDAEVGAIAGQVRVRNRENLVTSLQALEYLLANGSPGEISLPLILGSLIGNFLLQYLVAVFYLRFHREDPRLLRLLPFYGFYCNYFLNFAWFISAFDELRQKRMKW